MVKFLDKFLTSSDLLLERSVAKSDDPCYVEMESSFASIGRRIPTRIEKSVETPGETHANQVVEQTKLADNEDFIQIDDRKWTDIIACKNFNRNALSAETSKFVVRLVRHYDQHERETDGAVHWSSFISKLGDALNHPEDNDSQTKIGFITFMKEAAKLGSSIARIPKSVLLYFRAIQGHTGGEMVALELIGHVGLCSTKANFD